MALTEVREVHVAGTAGTSLSALIPLPAGTKVGDAVMVTTNGPGASSLGAGADQFPTTLIPPVGDPGARFYIGKLDRLDAIGVNVGGLGGTYSTHAQIITFTGTFDTNRYSMNGVNGGSSVVLPPISGSASGAIVSGLGWRSIGGPVWGGASGGGATWNQMLASGTYHLVGASWTGSPSIASGVTVSGSFTWVSALMIGVGVPALEAPPCRIFPRSDGLGVGAGRAFPPPKSQQRSPGNRGVGYY